MISIIHYGFFDSSDSDLPLRCSWMTAIWIVRFLLVYGLFWTAARCLGSWSFHVRAAWYSGASADAGWRRSICFCRENYWIVSCIHHCVCFRRVHRFLGVIHFSISWWCSFIVIVNRNRSHRFWNTRTSSGFGWLNIVKPHLKSCIGSETAWPESWLFGWCWTWNYSHLTPQLT